MKYKQVLMMVTFLGVSAVSNAGIIDTNNDGRLSESEVRTYVDGQLKKAIPSDVISGSNTDSMPKTGVFFLDEEAYD